ncbi:transcriptional regulator [Brachybacterium phenoliresistens]|uniref:Transcriptional regulator n=1 Tax=Brachybacterium phenoliresistens TaxID=396014 RepID=Z9JTM7_9MICO|nr:LCP family protein [Brachybacterium phenoliresistens]EWS81107.1 transcriptional regulator [Brachybacterium phenoliresistens]
MTTSDSIDLPGEIDPDEPPRRRRGFKIALVGLIVLAAIVAAAGVIAAKYMFDLRDAYEKRTVVQVTRGPSDGDRPEDTEGQNFLLLGSDKRSEEEAAASGITGQRSDVMMLVHVPADRSGVYFMSFPRDLYIDIPGHGKGRINAALAYGGIPLAVTTVENYTGVPIDHVALIDFDGVQGLVDTLGGVDVEVPQDFEIDGHQFTEGTQHVNGEEALAFVRARKNFVDGDFQRNRNQQALLRGIAKELLSSNTLSSPGRITEAVESISPYLTTDDALTPSAIVDLGLSLRDLRTSDLHFLAVPHGEPFMTSGGASVVATDEDGMDVLREALKNDSMGTYFAENAGKY